MAFPTSWLKKHKLTIDYTKVSGSANLTDFPVLLTEANFLAAAFDNSQGKEIYTNYLYNDANLQGYWRLESDGTDETANNNDLTGSGTPTHATGKFGNGTDLESDSSQYYYKASPTGLNITGSQTWSAWVKVESLHPTSSMAVASIDKETDRGRGFLVRNTGQVSFECSELTTNTIVSSTPTLSLATWSHIVGVYDSANSKLKVFVNGVKTEVTASGSTGSTTANFGIGTRFIGLSDTAFSLFDGMIDDVAVWDRALTDAEVMGLYTGGQDLRFSSDSAGSTQLAHEVVNWDIVGDKAEVWVKIPTVSYTANTVFYVWYDNDTALPQARDLASYGSDAVWSDYEGVYHLDGNGKDSSPNAYDVTATGSPVYSASGKIGSGVDLESGSSQYLIRTAPPNLQITGDLFVSCWFNSESEQAEYNMVALAGSDDSEAENDLFRIGAGSDENPLCFWEYGTGTNVTLTTSTQTFDPTSAWYHQVIVRDVSENTVDFYQNGNAEQETYANDPSGGSGADFLIGVRGGATNPFDGIIDEVRVAALYRSAGWIVTEYNNQSNPATFVTESVASNIKKLAGVVQASIKKVSGITNANTKKVAGVSN